MLTGATFSIRHRRPIHKLKKILCLHPYCIFFKSQLEYQTYRVKFHNDCSNIFNASADVLPRGNALCPMLYMLFTADFQVGNDVTTVTFTAAIQLLYAIAKNQLR